MVLDDKWWAGLFVFERHALKDQARQPKPEPLGAEQVVLAVKTETALNASCPQSGQGAVSSCCLKSCPKVLSQASQRYSYNGMIHLANLMFGNLYELYDLCKAKLKKMVEKVTKKGRLM
jgi:hypothetical protein